MTSLLNGEGVLDGTVLRTDIAVVGAGPAGISLARELSGNGPDVLLIESGAREPATPFQELSRGETVGTPYWPLHENRRRCVGGTTDLWAGWCRPLDDIDLSVRDWVPGSGWPLSRDELEPFLRCAHEILETRSFDYDVATWERELRARRLPLGPSIVTKVFHLSPPTRFGTRYLGELERASNVRILERATVLEIEALAESSAVSGLTVGTLGGKRFRVEPRAVVLAAGGLENARLLLLSDATRTAGLGNEYDQVGRRFMEHLHFVSGRLVLRRSARNVRRLYTLRAARTPVARLFLADHEQERLGVLHANVMLMSPTGKSARAVRAVHRAGERAIGRTTLDLAHTLEQIPDPANRVTLSDVRDALGQRRLRVVWRVGEAERRTLLAGRRVLAGAIERADLGTATYPDDDEEPWPPLELQGKRGHHMGTTRMSTTPKDGVVDPDCRVHGLSNLYVAGSSVFPTAGSGTPTLTIVALALRLAEHLRTGFRR